MYKLLPILKVRSLIKKNQVFVSVNPPKIKKKELWKAAIKWPLYSVAVMPILLATGWRIGAGHEIRIIQAITFLFASILLLLWENLTNDLFDDETGVDEFKLHSVVALIGSRKPVRNLAYTSLVLGLAMMLIVAIKSSLVVLFLIFGCCILGYLYQGPPFRLGYQGLGEPLCWIAFGPLATAAALIVITPNGHLAPQIPWGEAIKIGSGPALATTLVLFCSHFHQVHQDAVHGKKSLLVKLGTLRCAKLIPWFIAITILLESYPIIQGEWPITATLGLIGLPEGIKLINLLRKYHNKPERIKNSKFLALRFQTLNGLGLSAGFGIASISLLNFSH